jgi:hypothetical protein
MQKLRNAKANECNNYLENVKLNNAKAKKCIRNANTKKCTAKKHKN